jgi:hypothetical protein
MVEVDKRKQDEIDDYRAQFKDSTFRKVLRYNSPMILAWIGVIFSLA